MPKCGTIAPLNKRWSIKSDRLLLVEGKDEVRVFTALIRKCLSTEVSIQVISAGGKDQFRFNLAALKSDAQKRPTLRSIGVVRDADDNPTGAFQSVRDHIHNVGYVPPESHGTFSIACPSIGVFIIPNGDEQGALETLCRKSVQDTDTARCADQYLDCLKERGAMQPNNLDKSFAHAYLASQPNPMVRVGEGACKGVWNFGSPAFKSLVCFVRELSCK